MKTSTPEAGKVRMKSTTPAPDLTLYTFAMSHYSEKIRWMLDHVGLPYRERCMTPAFHMLPALWMGKRGQTTLPILRTPDTAIQDSPRIIDWLSRHHGPLDVLPTVHAKAIREVEQRFDGIGKDVARLLYAKSFGVADAHIVKLWTDFASPFEAMVIRRGYGFIRWAFRRKLSITEKRAVIAKQRIDEVVAWLDAQLSDGRTYLVGGAFSVADLTAASLLAPIACPRQHPVYGDLAFQRSMQGATQPWQKHRVMAWVREIYDRHRGEMKGGAFLQQPAMAVA
jgi:glutathione S-transferase